MTDQRRSERDAREAIPHDSQIVADVLLACDNQSDLYPLIGEHVEASDDD